MGQNFDEALAGFLAGILKIEADYKDTHFPTLPVAIFSTEAGPKNVRVVREERGSRSVHCFIERATGNVLKAAGWKAPAKHARGNIYDEHNGLKLMGPYGPAYLR